VLISVGFFSVVVLPSQAQLLECSWTGTWDLTFYSRLNTAEKIPVRMVLTQSGNSVVGTYDGVWQGKQLSGQLRGEVSQYSLEGVYYSQVGGTWTGSDKRTGRFWLRYSIGNVYQGATYHEMASCDNVGGTFGDTECDVPGPVNQYTYDPDTCEYGVSGTRQTSHTTSSSKTSTSTTPIVALYSVFMGDPNDAWAVGTNGWIVHWDGSKWTLVPSPKDNSRGNTLYSVFMVTWDDVWAVGSDGWIIHWDDSSWSNVQSPTRDTLTSIYMLSQNDGWAVGANGRIIHWDGTSWTNVASPTKQRLKSVSVSPSGTDAFAVGDAGTIVRWTTRTNTWELEKDAAMVPSPREWLNSVFVVDDDDVWAVGNLGQIIHYDGVNSMKWIKVQSPTVNNLNSLFMLSGFQGVAVGDRGTIIYLDLTSSEAWSKLQSSRQADLFSVSVEMMTGTDGLVVGQGGNVISLTIQPSYYQPGQTSTSIEKVKLTETSLEEPATTNAENGSAAYVTAVAVIIVIVVAAVAILLGRRFVTKRNRQS